MHRRLSKICGAYTSALSEAEMWVPDVASGDIPMADGSYWQVPSPQCWRFWSESWEGTPTQSHKPTDPDCDGIVRCMQVAREFRGTVHFECRVAGIARALEDAEAKAAKASAG